MSPKNRRFSSTVYLGESCATSSHVSIFCGFNDFHSLAGSAVASHSFASKLCWDRFVSSTRYFGNQGEGQRGLLSFWICLEVSSMLRGRRCIRSFSLWACLCNLSQCYFFVCNIRAAKRVIFCWRNLVPQSLKRSYKWQYLMHNSILVPLISITPGHYLFYFSLFPLFQTPRIYIK